MDSFLSLFYTEEQPKQEPLTFYEEVRKLMGVTYRWYLWKEDWNEQDILQITELPTGETYIAFVSGVVHKFPSLLVAELWLELEAIRRQAKDFLLVRTNIKAGTMLTLRTQWIIYCDATWEEGRVRPAHSLQTRTFNEDSSFAKLARGTKDEAC